MELNRSNLSVYGKGAPVFPKNSTVQSLYDAILGSTWMDHVLSESCNKVAILQRNFMKMTRMVIIL